MHASEAQVPSLALHDQPLLPESLRFSFQHSTPNLRILSSPHREIQRNSSAHLKHCQGSPVSEDQRVKGPQKGGKAADSWRGQGSPDQQQ